MKSSSPLSGVLPVLGLPFDNTGALDLHSLERVVHQCIESKVSGVVCFGLASELYKISDSERVQILRVVMETADRQIPVIVGTEHSGNGPAVERSIQAFEAGAAAVMLFPPTFVKPDEENIYSYYVSVGRSVPIPVIVQDAPAWTGVQLPVELLCEIQVAQKNVNHIKLESPPIVMKAQALKSAGFKILAGYGAVHLIEDLMAGVDGFMPGCGFPEIFLEIWNSFNCGEFARAKELYSKLLPLLTFQMTSLDAFIEVQKRLLVRQGIITTSYCRAPHAPLSKPRLDYLDELLEQDIFSDLLSRKR
jgi:2-keto-3-deoxy-L-arabinonate dehydratase